MPAPPEVVPEVENPFGPVSVTSWLERPEPPRITVTLIEPVLIARLTFVVVPFVTLWLDEASEPAP